MMPVGSQSQGMRATGANNQFVVSVGVGILGLAAAWILSGYVSDSDYTSLVYSVLLVAVAAITVSILKKLARRFLCLPDLAIV